MESIRKVYLPAMSDRYQAKAKGTELSYEETDEVPEAHRYGRTLQGRCLRCGVAYRWEARAPLPRRLYEARCPRCQGGLMSTTHLLKSVPWMGFKARVTVSPSLAKANKRAGRALGRMLG